MPLLIVLAAGVPNSFEYRPGNHQEDTTPRLGMLRQEEEQRKWITFWWWPMGVEYCSEIGRQEK